jgi:hypothetical protein
LNNFSAWNSIASEVASGGDGHFWLARLLNQPPTHVLLVWEERGCAKRLSQVLSLARKDVNEAWFCIPKASRHNHNIYSTAVNVTVRGRRVNVGRIATLIPRHELNFTAQPWHSVKPGNGVTLALVEFLLATSLRFVDGE